MHDGGGNIKEQEFLLCLGSMTALALVTNLACKAGVIDQQELYRELTAAQDMATDNRRIPLAMLHLMLELFETRDHPAF